MDQQEGTHVLRQLATDALDAVNQLEREEPDLWLLTDFAATLSLALLGSAMLEDLGPNEPLPQILWQQMTKYQFNALLHFVSRELDSGYTLLRNATELVRDVVYLGSNPESAPDWWKSRSVGKPDPRFRFNRSDSFQAYVHDLYKLLCKLGTHGHITGLSGSQPSGFAGTGDRIQIREVTDTSRNEALGMWLLAFFPMQYLCARIFVSRASADFVGLLRELTFLGKTFGEAAKRLRARRDETP